MDEGVFIKGPPVDEGVFIQVDEGVFIKGPPVDEGVFI